IGTPHIGGATDLSFCGIARKVAENVERLRRGEMLVNCANPAATRVQRGRSVTRTRLAPGVGAGAGGAGAARRRSMAFFRAISKPVSRKAPGGSTQSGNS